jgi:hypothetical protein
VNGRVHDPEEGRHRQLVIHAAATFPPERLAELLRDVAATLDASPIPAASYTAAS